MTPGPPGGGQAEPLHTGGGGVVIVGPAILGSVTDGGRGGGQADPLQPGGGGGVTMVGPGGFGPRGAWRAPAYAARWRRRCRLLGCRTFARGGPSAASDLRPGPAPVRRLKRARASGPARPNWTSVTDCDASGVKAVRTSGAEPAGESMTQHAAAVRSSPAAAAPRRVLRRFSRCANGSMALDPYQLNPYQSARS